MLKRLRSQKRNLAKENKEIVAAHNRGDLSQALVIADRLIREHGNDPLLLFSRGSVRMAQGRNDEAVKDFTLAIENAADSAAAARVDALISRGACHKLAGNHRLSEKDYDKALEAVRADKALGSRLPTLLLNRGQLFDAMALPKEAIESYTEFIKTQARSELLPIALNNRGLALMKLDDPRSLALAADDFNGALSLAPETAVFHHNYALCLHAQGDRAGALREQRLAARFDPKFVRPERSKPKADDEDNDNDEDVYNEKAPKKPQSEAVDAPLLANKKKPKKARGSKRASVNDDHEHVTPTSSEE